MLLSLLLPALLRCLTVTGTLSQDETTYLQEHKIKYVQENKEELADDLPRTLNIEDKDTTKLNISIENKVLLDVLGLIKDRKNNEVDFSKFKDVMGNLEKVGKESLSEKIMNGKMTFFLIFTNKMSEVDLPHLRILKEKEIPFFISSDEKVAKELGVQFPGVLAYNAIENVTYKLDNLNAGIVLAPILSILSTDSMKNIDIAKVPAFYVFVTDELEAKKELKEIALEKRSELKMSLIKFVDFQTDLTHFGITKEDLPAMVHVSENREKFVLKKVTTKRVQQFFGDFFAKKLKPFVRSQDEIADKKEDNVKYLVGINHDKFLKSNENKDLLVVYGSEKCPHCVKLLPTLQTLAKSLAGNKNVQIAYIDLEKNDVSVKIEAFPTLLLYPAVEKGEERKNIKYSDFSRTENAIKKFIKTSGNKNKDLEVEEEEPATKEIGTQTEEPKEEIGLEEAQDIDVAKEEL